MFYYTDITEICGVNFEDFVRKLFYRGMVGINPKAIYYHKFEFKLKNQIVKQLSPNV